MIRSYIPHIVTLLNIYAGCGAVVAFMHGQNRLGIFLVICSIVADFFDGLVARALNVISPLGKQLDSLADVISFGLVPAVIFYRLLSEGPTLSWAGMPAFILTAFAAYRLGIFNLDDRQQTQFIGLPTPACTLFVMGYLIWIDRNAFGAAVFFSESGIIYLLIGLFSLLMVSSIPMFSFKFNSMRWGGNEIKFIFTAIAIVGIIVLRELAIAPLVLVYILLSVGTYGIKTK